MNEKQDSNSLERLKFAYQLQQKEMDYRREKRWRIFSWVSSLLVGSIAGAVAITADSTKTLPTYPHKTFMIAAVLALAIYAILWEWHNRNAEANARTNMDKIEDSLKLYEGLFLEPTDPGGSETSRSSIISYNLIIILLALAAIAIILLS
jgi:hypothetical protein